MLITSAKNAIFYEEDSEAKKLLHQIEDFVNSENLAQTNPDLLKKLEKLIIYLKITAFSNLTDEQSAEVLRKYYLESFEIDISLENRLVSKLFIVPFIPRDTLRKQLKQALLENNQLLGSLTISQWIQAFEKDFDVHTRKPSAVIEFIQNNTNARKIDQSKQNILKKILHTYDYLLVSTLPTTEPELSNMLETMKSTEFFSQNSDSKVTFNPVKENVLQENTTEQKTASLPFNQALKNYPEIGEQLITSMRIKLKSFPEPVRPSINNWLSDYTFNLGFESHRAMDRGTYLFRNENAKILNSADRERLSYILKAYDENSLVDVNVNTKQIVFPKREQAVFNGGSTSKREVKPPRTPYQAPQRNVSEIYNAQIQKDQPRDIFKKEREASENKNTGNINFSSPQKMPYEKQIIQPVQPQSIPPTHTPLQNQGPRPMRISSQNLRDREEETPKPRINPNVPPGNIVNLKDQ